MSSDLFILCASVIVYWPVVDVWNVRKVSVPKGRKTQKLMAATE